MQIRQYIILCVQFFDCQYVLQNNFIVIVFVFLVEYFSKYILLKIIFFNVVVFYFVFYKKYQKKCVRVCDFFKLVDKINFKEEKEFWIMLIIINYWKGIYFVNYSQFDINQRFISFKNINLVCFLCCMCFQRINKLYQSYFIKIYIGMYFFVIQILYKRFQ